MNEHNIIPLQATTIPQSLTGKRITIVAAESGMHHDLIIQPGTTAADIRRQTGMDDQRVITKARGHEPFGEDENVYEQVPDGAKLYATTPVEVGGFLSFLTGRSDYELLTMQGWVKRREAVPVPRRQAAIAGFRPAATGGPVTVERDTRSYWQQRGWHHDGNEYHGFFRTAFGSWKGRAEQSPSTRLDLFIHQPPQALARHPHWQCFFLREKQWFFIHHNGASDLSSAIIEVERILTEAHLRRDND